MSNSLFVKDLKAIIKNIIVALFITGIIYGVIYFTFGDKINEIISLINRVAIVNESDIKNENIKISKEMNRLESYPEYGTKYATMIIPKIDVNLPVYYGDTLELLKEGIGHSSGSYFPGEGGSIIYMGHNSEKMLRRLGEVQIGNEIIVKTVYGDYTYKVYDMQLVEENEVEKLPIQEENEILMLYTCYPFNNIGYTTQRYVVYSKIDEQGGK